MKNDAMPITPTVTLYRPGYFEVVDVYAAEYYKYGEQDACYGEFP